MHCSICSTAKRQTNNWWRLYYAIGEKPKHRWCLVESLESENTHEGHPFLVLCGIECLMKAASAILAGQMPRLRDAEGLPV